MKLTALLLTLACMSVSAKVLSQSVTFTGKNVSLEKVFSVVRSQTGYHVFCDDRLLSQAAPVTVSATNMPLQKFLDLLLKNQSLQYLVREQTIFVSPKAAPIPAEAASPGVPVQGHIYDEVGNPLSGTTIKIKGTNRSVISGNDGSFNITANVGDVLVFTFVGFQPQEIRVGNSTNLDIKLHTARVDIGEVTVASVSTGYQQITAERATGSYGVITAKELQNVPSTNILEKLEGKEPGVMIDVRRNTIQLRSVNTYTLNQTPPLIVIDGFPMLESGDNQKLTSLTNSTMANNAILSTINPADIAQITFLKDAVATSIWGARGANGVIVIDTKKGKRGMTTLNLSSTVSVAGSPKFSDLHWMNTAQYVDLEKELVNKGFITDATQTSYYNPLQAYNPSEVQEWLFKVQRGTATQAEADAAISKIATRDNSGQIKKYLLQNAVTQQYNLSLSGGDNSNTYYISANYNRDQPIYKSNSAENMFLTANLTNDLFNKRVRVTTGINYQYATSKVNGSAVDALSLSQTSLRPYDMLVDSSGQHIQHDILFRPEVAEGLVAKGYLPFSYNAVDELNYSNTISKTNQFRINTGINVKITDWLNADITGMYQRNMTNSNGIDELQSYLGRIFVNNATTISSTGKVVYNLPKGGIYRLHDASAYDYNLRAQLNASRQFNADNQFTALAGAEIKQAYNKGYGSTQYGYDPLSNTFGTVNPTTPYATMYGWTSTLGNPFDPVTEQRNRYLSYFGNAAYTYKSRYNLSGSMRFDDYTLLGLARSKRAKPFYSVGFKWNMKEEGFLQPIAWVNGLDLRITYGTGGSVPLAGSTLPVVTVNSTDYNTGLPTGTIQTPANEQLQWELTHTFNMGADLRVLHDRITASVDVYFKRNSGILANLPFNPTYGWSYVSFNTGTMKSHGVELGITGKIVDQRDWGITSTFNFSYSANMVTDSRYKPSSGSSLIQGSTPVKGRPIGGVYVYRSAGLDNQGQTQIYDHNNKIISSTTNLTSDFGEKDVKYAGTSVSPYFGGFFNTFRYKQFELGVQMTYYMGGVFLKPAINNYPTFAGYFSGTLGRQEDLAKRWEKPGDEATTNVPGLDYVNSNSITRYRYSDKLVRSSDNIRLQQISLTYNFPASLLSRKVIRGLSVSGNVRNLGMLWARNKEKLDPEYLNSTATYAALPPVTSYLFNVNISF
ncbi:TonB-linked outer membrane protein, SusC/RagA family [Chitinophaga costaii]|uniref:TonB-linked outer membrane protein, SusC/RagA family n=1 Tax=Chitinophaga costaii TaxID=1335309 RepID=A0A1C4ELU1_9BACT|nr:SusC/RagA family TonB-linked outer membrane protein [Chitinophaga costaii]SCC44599.1 TonB-linked outer membrane protein, SusC/RagA family [Chitinophaga costaii]